MQISGYWSLLTFVILAGCSLSDDVEDDVANFSTDIVQWVKNGEEPAGLRAMIDKLALPRNWKKNDPKIFIEDVNPRSICVSCKAFVRSTLSLRREGTPGSKIEGALGDLCVRLNFYDDEVCHGHAKLHLPVLFWIMDNDPNVPEDDYCALPLQNYGCVKLSERFEWTVETDDHSAQLLDVTPSEKSVKILHISDIHYDPEYEVAGNADCDEPACCRRGQGPARNLSATAGFWGDYRNCDVPWHSVVDALSDARVHHGDADLIYYTGDVVHHGEWKTTRQGNRESLQKVYGKMREIFGDKAVYPVIGNHESHPLNVYASQDVDDDGVSSKWLYELLADLWISVGWLPESTRGTILRGGFYTVSPRRGLRVIVLNNNVAYNHNWWLLHEPNDIGGQLKWLADTLRQAEESSEAVHVLTHVPAGSFDHVSTWSREYRRIVNRFAHIISAQFTGHTHKDEFNIFYNPDNHSEVVNVAWNGGSVTTWTFLNPNYRVYKADANTYEVEEAETWIYNLTKANLTPLKPPSWFLSYSFREEYGLRDLSKGSLHNLVTEIAKGSAKTEAYHRNYNKLADPAISAPCNKTCAAKYACRIVTTVSNNSTECDYIKQQN